MLPDNGSYRAINRRRFSSLPLPDPGAPGDVTLGQAANAYLGFGWRPDYLWLREAEPGLIASVPKHCPQPRTEYYLAVALSSDRAVIGFARLGPADVNAQL